MAQLPAGAEVESLQRVPPPRFDVSPLERAAISVGFRYRFGLENDSLILTHNISVS